MESQWETMAAIDDEKFIPSYLLLPFAFEPTLPSIPETALLRDLGSMTPETFKQSPFIALDRERMSLSSPSLDIFNDDSQKLAVWITGPLADKKLIPLALPISSFTNQPLHTFTFDVRVDDHTGEICWFQEKNESSSNEMLSTAVECLKALRFEEDKAHFVSAGEIKLSIPQQRHE
jgi:hypothetical protein